MRIPFALALACAAPAMAATPALAQEEEAPPVDRSQDLAWHNQQMLALAKRAATPGWRQAEGGLLWHRIAGDGSGAHPTTADMVTIHYAGTFADGSEFDSSYGRGEPATFPLGRLIKAWQIAVPLMGVGDTIEIAVPAPIGYGAKGKGPIPGGATLLFKIELLAIGPRQ